MEEENTYAKEVVNKYVDMLQDDPKVSSFVVIVIDTDNQSGCGLKMSPEEMIRTSQSFLNLVLNRIEEKKYVIVNNEGKN
jgi:hypothetical protein